MKWGNGPHLRELTGLPYSSLSPSSWFDWMAKLPFWKKSVRWQQFAGVGQDFPEGCICSESVPNILCSFSLSQDLQHQGNSSVQGVEMKLPPLTVTQWAISKFWLPVPMTLCFSGLEFLVPEGGMLPPGDTTTIALNGELGLTPRNPGLLIPWIHRQRSGLARDGWGEWS